MSVKNYTILHLGSNLGYRHRNLLLARTLLQDRLGQEIICSSCYETSAWGVEDQAAFLNIASIFHTALNAEEVLSVCLAVETAMGRIRHQHWGPRLIDIDVLAYNEEICDTAQLTLPHPRLSERRFVLVPLAEIAPSWLHPEVHLSATELLVKCEDQGTVIKVYQNNKELVV